LGSIDPGGSGEAREASIQTSAEHDHRLTILA
jgi:hypothetical protein